MRIYLVQHGQAVSSDENPDRPLSTDGRTETNRMADFAATSGEVAPVRIWHSGKTRAAQSAEILAAALKPPLGVRSSDGLDPKDDPETWATRLPEMSQDVMLVGHLPHLSRLASALLAGDASRGVLRFAHAGIVCLEFDQQWRLVWAVTPALLPPAGPT
jgi:phosphohistidine phosphatase